MLPQEIIRTKRDGQALSAGDIAAFIGGLTSGDVAEGQAAAFAMAVFFNGMRREEAVALAGVYPGGTSAEPGVERPKEPDFKQINHLGGLRTAW